MYFITLIVFLITLIYSILVGQQGWEALRNFYDISSIFIIAFMTIPMLLASGLFNDLKRSFKVMVNKHIKFTKLELQRSLEAINLTMKLIMYSGFLGSLIGSITMLAHIDEPKAIGPNCAVMLLTIFYALFLSLIFMPIRSRLMVLILSYSDEK